MVKRNRKGVDNKETAMTVAMMRRLRKKIAQLEEAAPEDTLHDEYRDLIAHITEGLELFRLQAELVLALGGATRRQREIATERLYLIALMESECTPGVADSTH